MSALAAHREDDSRACGASTIVSGQSTVFVNGKLWAVDGDQNSHGGGSLSASLANNVFINNKKVVLNTESAGADSLCDSNIHCSPNASSGSPDVFTGI